jgi:hypothetical protein
MRILNGGGGEATFPENGVNIYKCEKMFKSVGE